jgi:hypothetical protein|tara:strand:- start:16756 stop:17988 length:1233 start_codon:yes stop_codon:yes gene_type:complete
MAGLLDLLGFDKGAGSYYLKDFKNAYRFRPDVNPPRQQFNGYVNFILNRSLYSTLYDEIGATSGDNKEFGITISSLVRTADLPSVDFQIETKNSYNRKKIIQTGVTYNPVNIMVFDTVGNEWLSLLMKYFSYHFMDPRNKQDGNSRDIEGSVDRRGGIEDTAGSAQDTPSFGKGSDWDSNRAGINAQVDAHFFERIDYVLYHGGKLVQYSLHNPRLSSFKPSSLDYSSSEAMGFDLTFDYERFTTFSKLNSEMSVQDLDRFENASGLEGELFEQQALNASNNLSLTETDLDPILTGRPRSSAPIAVAPPTDGNESKQEGAGDEVETAPSTEVLDRDGNLPSTYGSSAIFANPTGARDEIDGFGGFLRDVADTALSSLINGGSVKENTARVVTQAVQNASVQVRSDKFGGS